MAMASKFRKLLSIRQDSRNSEMLNSYAIGKNKLLKALSPENFDEWDISKVIIGTIYKIGAFNFQTAFSIKIHEEIMSLQNGLQTIYLIKLEAIRMLLKDKFHFMRIGLVPVVVKPLIRKGLMHRFTWF